MYRFWALLIFFVAIVEIAKAQQIEEISCLGIEDGLSNNSINSVFKDSYGYMWFGTDDGLNRYDGYEFKVFRSNKNDPSSLIFNRIVCLGEEDNGDLWVGTKNGLSIYNNFSSKFDTPRYYNSKSSKSKLTNMEINSILNDDNGGMWVATNKQGLLYKPKNKSLIKIPFNFEKDLADNYNVIAMAIDQKKIWFVIEGKGLFAYNLRTHQVNMMNKLFSSAISIYKERRGVLWIGGDQGLYSYNSLNDQIKWNKSLNNDKVIRVTDIKKHRNGEIWVATDGGGISILDSTGTKIREIISKPGKKNLRSNAVMSILSDNDGKTWLGTLRGGVNVIDNRKNRFNTVYHNPNNTNSLINDFVLSFCEDRKGNVWIGTDGGGLSVWNRKTNFFKNYVSLPRNNTSLNNNNITSIIEDKTGNIWIGTFGGGINKFNPDKNEFEHFSCKNPEGEDKNIWKLYCDSKNNIWVGTTFGQNYTYSFNRSQQFFEVVNKSLDHIITIAEDDNNDLWFGSESGKLSKFDSQSKQIISYQFQHPIRSIYPADNENFWVGVQYTGLIHLNIKTNKIKIFTETEGLCNNSVLNILADAKNNLWISSFQGISRFSLKTEKFANFYDADGLQSNQFNYNAALKLKDGDLLFGGIKGFNVFNPQAIKNYDDFPKLLVIDLQVMNKPLTTKHYSIKDSSSLANLKELTLAYNDASLTLEFAALEFSAPKKIKYAYFLEGWDKSWSYTSNRLAHYSRLTEGNYTFRIKYTNTDGAWNPIEKLIYINILPPWYRSLWAYMFYLLGLVGAVFIYNRYRVREADLKYQLQINKIKADKDAELNESKFAFFTNISHEFRTPLTLIINPVKDLLKKSGLNDGSERLQVIYKNSKRLLNLVDQLLLFRKVDSDTYKLQVSKFNLQKLCLHVFDCFKNEAQLRQISYTLIGNVDLEFFGDKEKIEIILFNLIGNAIKYTPEKEKVTLKVEETETDIFISVEDTGCGIEKEVQEKLFDKFYQIHPKSGHYQSGFGIGLYLVKTFVTMHSGNVTLDNNLPQGSIFRLQLKKGNRHYGNGTIFLENEPTQTLLNELKDDSKSFVISSKEPFIPVAIQPFVNEKKSILVVDDHDDMRNYIISIFENDFSILEAHNGLSALEITKKEFPNIIISDVMMEGLDGIGLCAAAKNDPATNHIPIILLTASASAEAKLKGIKGGADDYVSKPFDVEQLKARVNAMLKSRADLHQYFFNEITQNKINQHVTEEQRDFLSACTKVILTQLQNLDFNVEALANEMGMSHSNLYKKIKSSSGESANYFIRFVRLKKAAEILVYTDSLVNEAALACGINDIKYFREQFNKVFGMQPSEFIKKHRPVFKKKFKLNK